MNPRKHNHARRLARAGIQFAAVLLALYLLAAVAALNVPGLIVGMLLLNALLGIYFKIGGIEHEKV